MTLIQAVLLADTARNEAAERGEKLAIAVFDANGSLMTFQNMEISETECIAYAQQKALTALRLGCDTSALAHLVKKPDGILVKLRYDKSICLMGGGKLIVRDNSVIGALGVSGAAEETDAAIAELASKVLS